jgi:hypothetical protein
MHLRFYLPYLLLGVVVYSLFKQKSLEFCFPFLLPVCVNAKPPCCPMTLPELTHMHLSFYPLICYLVLYSLQSRILKMFLFIGCVIYKRAFPKCFSAHIFHANLSFSYGLYV